MRNLVRRYVTVEQRKTENQGVTEDDVNEIKQDISAFRFELIEILKNSGMNTSTAQAGIGRVTIISSHTFYTIFMLCNTTVYNKRKMWKCDVISKLFFSARGPECEVIGK